MHPHDKISCKPKKRIPSIKRANGELGSYLSASRTSAPPQVKSRRLVNTTACAPASTRPSEGGASKANQNRTQNASTTWMNTKPPTRGEGVRGGKQHFQGFFHRMGRRRLQQRRTELAGYGNPASSRGRPRGGDLPSPRTGRVPCWSFPGLLLFSEAAQPLREDKRRKHEKWQHVLLRSREGRHGISQQPSTGLRDPLLLLALEDGA